METHEDIRPLLASDQDFIWEALYVALWDPPGGPRRPRTVLQEPRIACYAQDWTSRTGDLGFAATSTEGKPIGAVWSRLFGPPNPAGAFFDAETPQLGIAVLPGYQGRGIGSRLLARYLAEARRFHARVSLSVHPANAHALHLYRRAGFVQFANGGGGYLNMVCHLRPASDQS